MANPIRSRRNLVARSALLVLCAAVVAAGALPAAGAEAAEVAVKELDGKIRVEIDGELFTEYIYKGYGKPILYPVIGPHGIGMTRNYPMKKGVEGEAKDHVHQMSLWYTHGRVNGLDFWHEGKGAGKIVHDKLVKIGAGSGRGIIQAANKWVDTKGKVICTDTTTLRFFALPGGRAIDWDLTISASAGDVTFGDTKEGSMGIRTHPALRLRGPKAKGKAVNSEGVKDRAVWGKRAKWVDYWAPIDGHTVGVAIFDHASNPRHPTWWHARDYGLIAANPFGIKQFDRKAKTKGDMKIPAGESVTFRYRFVFHEGDYKQAKIADLYKQYVAAKPKTSK